MSTPRLTELAERIHNGAEYIASAYDTDIDILVPKQFLITAGAKKCHMVIRCKGPAAAVVALNKTVIIGSAGGFTVGTAVTICKRDQADTSTPVTTIGEDYLIGTGGGASAGTAVITEYHFPNIQTEIKFKLAASTIYGLIFTSIADNNSATFHLEFDEY